MKPCPYHDPVRGECGSGDNPSWQCDPKACPVPEEKKQALLAVGKKENAK
jgi:hypothetical protein